MPYFVCVTFSCLTPVMPSVFSIRLSGTSAAWAKPLERASAMAAAVGSFMRLDSEKVAGQSV